MVDFAGAPGSDGISWNVNDIDGRAIKGEYLKRVSKHAIWSGAVPGDVDDHARVASLQRVGWQVSQQNDCGMFKDRHAGGFSG